MNVLHSSRPLLTAVLLLCASAALHAQTPTRRPIPLNSDSLGFSVQFPGTYMLGTPEVQPIESQAGVMEVTTWSAPSYDHNSLCMVVVTEYPREMYDLLKAQGNYDVTTKTLLDTAVNGGMRNLNNAKVTSKKNVTLNGIIGQSIRLQTTRSGRKIYGRIDYFILENRLYQVGYLAVKKKSVDAASIVGYFKSFQIMMTKMQE